MPLQFHRRGEIYESGIEGTVIPLYIVARGQTLKITAILDTGSQFCMFDHGVAESLEIDLELGIPLRVRTLASYFQAQKSLLARSRWAAVNPGGRKRQNPGGIRRGFAMGIDQSPIWPLLFRC
jgi:hypothetical protein